MHLRLLNGQALAVQTPLEAHHCARSAAMFREDISRPAVDPQALWMPAVMLSFTDSFTIDPAHANDTLSTTWLKTHSGVRMFYDMLLLSSAFRIAERGSVDACLGMHQVPQGCTGIPTLLADLYELDNHSNAQDNAYHEPVHVLVMLQSERHVEPLRFLAFANVLDARFVRLLEVKDRRALLLLMLWYELVPQTAWWLYSRAQISGHAIRDLLNKEGHANPQMQRLLDGEQQSVLKSAHQRIAH